MPCPGQNGLNGTCMFSFECIKGRGVPIGVCISGYFVRSCCHFPNSTKPKPTVINTTTLSTTTSTTSTPTTSASTTITTSTSPPTTTRPATQPAFILSNNKQSTKVNPIENNLEKLNNQKASSLSNLTPSPTQSSSTTSKFSSIRSTDQTTSSTQKPKINSEFDLTLATTTNKPLSSSVKLNDLLTTNSPTLIEATNDITELDENANELSNEKVNQTLKLVQPSTNYTNEFTAINSLNQNLSIISSLSVANSNQSSLSIDSSFNNLEKPLSVSLNTLEKKNVANQPEQLIANSSSAISSVNNLVNNSTNSLVVDNATSTSLPTNSSIFVASSAATTSTTTQPTTLKYVDLLKPLNKTTNISHNPTSSSISDLTTEKTSTESIIANSSSHRIAIVYNPTTSTTTTTTTTTSKPLSANESTSTDSTTDSPVNIKSICGKRLNFPKGRIVGGTKSYFGEWPWMVSLRQWRRNAFLHKCGAALLNEYWAITAAHCVEK